MGEEEVELKLNRRREVNELTDRIYNKSESKGTFNVSDMPCPVRKRRGSDEAVGVAVGRDRTRGPFSAPLEPSSAQGHYIIEYEYGLY